MYDQIMNLKLDLQNIIQNKNKNIIVFSISRREKFIKELNLWWQEIIFIDQSIEYNNGKSKIYK